MVAEIINAWYGTESQHSDNGGQVQNILRRDFAATNNTRLHVPGDMNRHFGFDPVPNVVKVLAIHVRVDGVDHHLRAHEGSPFEWIIPAHVEIVNAWYGTEQQHSDNAGRVQEILRENLARHGGIRICFPTGDLFGSFGFDPVPNVLKECAVHVRVNGHDHHLRINEGRPFDWIAQHQ